MDYTEYRVNGGAWTKGTTVTVSAVGAYAVEYRSADKAGNVETAKSVAFSIKAKVTPTPTADRRPPTATPNTPAATPTPVAPVPTATPAPKPKPSFKLAKPAKTTVAKFAKSGLKVRATCSEAMSGQATVTVTSKVRKALKLKSATLAKATVKCKAGTTTITLKPSASMQARAGEGQEVGQGQGDRDPQAGGCAGAQGHGQRDLGPQVTRSPLQGPE